MSIYLFIYQYRDFFYNLYAIATCFQQKSATRSLVRIRIHRYATRAFDISCYLYRKRCV